MSPRYPKAQRRLYLTWKNARGPSWTKRARLYVPPTGSSMDHRIEIEDIRVYRDGEYLGGGFRTNIYRKTLEEAEAVVREFEAGKTVKEFIDGGY